MWGNDPVCVGRASARIDLPNRVANGRHKRARYVAHTVGLTDDVIRLIVREGVLDAIESVQRTNDLPTRTRLHRPVLTRILL